MSIINQMLQKLEQRRGGRDATLPDGVRAVGKVSNAKNKRPFFIQGVTLVLIAGVGYSGWFWWQLQGKPAKSVAVTGKIPSVAASLPPKPQISAPSVADDTQALIEAAKAARENSTNRTANSVPVNSQKRNKPARQEIAESQAAKERIEENALSHIPETRASVPKRASRESAGKIRAGREGQDSNMKLVTPLQLALSHYQKALSWLQQGRVAEARSALDESLKLDPTYLSARQALAGLLVEGRQFNQAEQVLQEGLNFNPEQQGFAMALARLEVERGDTRVALDTLYKYLPYAYDNAEYQAFIAALQQRSEQHKKAIEHYQAALRLASSGAWYMGLGISLQAEHRLEEAQDAFSKAKASNELAPGLLTFVEQRLRMVKRLQQGQLSGDAK